MAANGSSAEDLERIEALARELCARGGKTAAAADEILVQVDRARQHLHAQTQIIDQINDSIITMDLAGYVKSWNRGAEKLFGYTAAEAVGRHVLFLYADPDNEADDFQGAFLEHGGREVEVRRRRKSGEIFWAGMQLSLLRDADGQPTGILGYLTDITSRIEARERIHYLAYYDALTDLPNRALFYKLIDQALTEARRNRRHGAVLFIDLNRFKPINDTLGHGVGDQLLQQIGARIRAALRAEDVVARIGGDEFVVALVDIAQREHAGIVAQKLLASLDDPFMIDGHELRVGAAIGISVYPQDAFDTETLLRLADIAMYRAKQSGTDSYVFYSQEMNQRALDRLKTENSLRRAIERDELLLHFQPKVDIKSGRIVGAEALVRWRHPELGMVPPGQFIPVAEESGLIVQVSAWVLDAAVRQAAAWQAAELEPIKIAVNLSARDFSPTLPQRIAEVLGAHGLAPDWLELEITEGMLMHSTDRVIAMMDQLAEQGISLSLDDFGTGYSSLSYFKRFPIDTLKIDRSFVINIPGDGNDCAIAGAIIGMAKQLGHKVIAEGVETREQLVFLRTLGCDELQGYLFSPPVPSEQFEAMLRADKRLGLD